MALGVYAWPVVKIEGKIGNYIVENSKRADPLFHGDGYNHDSDALWDRGEEDSPVFRMNGYFSYSKFVKHQWDHDIYGSAVQTRRDTTRGLFGSFRFIFR